MTWGDSCRGGQPRPGRGAIGTLLALACAAALPGSALAKETVSATATSHATIVAPLSLVKQQDLAFGRIVARTTAGTVTVDQITGQCAVTGAIMVLGGCQFASFAGMGTKNMNARVSLGAITNLTGPGQTMVLDNITLGTNSTISFAGNPNANGRGVGLTQGGGNQRYSIATNSGIFVLNIGGRLNVNANQAPGLYTGSITVTVQYQ